MQRYKILFIYDSEYEVKDGLWAALNLLEKDFEIFKLNLKDPHIDRDLATWPDFVLGWGGFNSAVDDYISKFDTRGHIKKGLCIGGNAFKIDSNRNLNYDVLFYETEWVRHYLELDLHHNNLIHAFGVNTHIYYDMNKMPLIKAWDYITVGAFAYWKRQSLLVQKEGTKLAIGQIQRNNLNESIDIIGNLILGHCAVSDMVSPERLALIYNSAKTCYIPADLMGGGERAVLEARACGLSVEVEDDNPKLKELLTSPVWDEKYYAKQLKEGILKCI